MKNAKFTPMQKILTLIVVAHRNLFVWPAPVHVSVCPHVKLSG